MSRQNDTTPTATTVPPAFPIKTADEIVDRIETEDSDFLGFRHEVLVGALPYSHAKTYLEDDVAPEDWEVELSRKAVMAEMISYLGFAWGKALDHRGISASRSVIKITEWLWILGDEEAEGFAQDDDNYPQYGAPVLLYVSDRYGSPVPGGPEALNMANGNPCVSGCPDGCGRP